MMAAAATARVSEVLVARRTDETRIAEKIDEHERALDAGEAEATRLKVRLEALERQNKYHRDALARLRGTPIMSVAEALRVFLKERGPSTAKEAELWLRARGYTTSAESFYHSVHATLRAMPEVVAVLKQGETMRFALKEGLRVPKGYHMAEFPRRKSPTVRETLG